MAERLPPTPITMPARANTAATGAQSSEKGITWNDDMQKELDSTMETLATYAKSAGKSEAEYIKQLYGSNMTVKIFKGILKDTIIASHYQQDYIDSLTYTDDELQKYYQENKNSFDVANYQMITFNGAAAPTKDADGNTVSVTQIDFDAHPTYAGIAGDLIAGQHMVRIPAFFYRAATVLAGEHAGYVTGSTLSLNGGQYMAG